MNRFLLLESRLMQMEYSADDIAAASDLQFLAVCHFLVNIRARYNKYTYHMILAPMQCVLPELLLPVLT